MRVICDDRTPDRGYCAMGNGVPLMPTASGAARMDFLWRGRDDPRAAWKNACEAGRVGIAEHDRRALVERAAEIFGERDLAQQRHVELVGEHLAAALAEDVAVHVLDHPKQLDVVADRRLSRARGAQPSAPRPAAS